MARLTFTAEEETLLREIMAHVRYHVLTCREPRMYLGLTPAGSFRGFFRSEGVVNAGALKLLSFRKLDDGLALTVKCVLAAEDTDLYAVVRREAAKGPASAEETKDCLLL